MTIKQPALVSPPQSRPAPTRRALPAKPAAQRGQNWTPIDMLSARALECGNPPRAQPRFGGLLRAWGGATQAAQWSQPIDSTAPHCGRSADCLCLKNLALSRLSCRQPALLGYDAFWAGVMRN